MDLLAQLNQAMAYIEDHIDGDLALADVAKATSYSAYHFGRLFYYIADMPLSEYIRKRKLSLAAIELQSSRDTVMSLAVKYGYDSADSFARAFVRQHGITPSAARKQGAMLKSFPPITFQIKIEGVRGMNWRIEQREAFDVVGVGRRFGNDETDLISDYWGEKIEDGSLKRLKQQVGRKDLIGACGHIDEEKNDFFYMIGLFADENTNKDGFEVFHAPAATWAVFRSPEFDRRPDGAEIPKLFKSALQEWLPSSGHEKLEGRDGEIYDMEIYGVTDGGKYYEEVWLSVVKK